VIDMVNVTIKRKQFLDFISSFGDVDDLKITFKDDTMSCTVAYISHYLKKYADGGFINEVEGDLDISELKKVKQFLKASKDEFVKIKQTGSGKTLHIIAGASKVTFPTSSTIVSYSKAPLFEKLVDKAKASKWTKFHDCELTVHGDINLEDLVIVSKMRGILNSSPVFTINAHVGEGEFTISSGKKHEAKLFTTTPLVDAWSDTNENVGVKSTFGAWLMDNLKLFSTGGCRIHMGESTMIVFVKGDNLLVVVDQRM
tara:strand:- start:739 stop:1506 length:768 start_codon:yes stop_codon:yes gene_type:complete